MVLPPAVIIHGLPHARAALARGHAVTLLSAPGAPSYAGVAWWRALVAAARAEFPGLDPPDVLDCGDAPGRALEALSLGCRMIVLRPGPAFADIAERAAAQGARLLAEPPTALNLGDRAAVRRLDAWLGVTAARPSAKPPASVQRNMGGTMQVTPTVKGILDNYESDNPGSKANLARILMQGRLAGTGKMVILPVDQGFEHGPARSFAPNPAAYDPQYHFRLALAAGLNAYAAPLGMIEAGASTYAGALPTILKVNSSNSLATEKDQAVTGSVTDALRLGCSAIGFTIYPGSEYAFAQMEELREMAEEAKSVGLAVVVWSYPRGPALDKAAETAVDICAYAAHMAALLGAHIIKVKPPTAVVSLEAAKKTYETQDIDISTMAKRVAHVVQCCFNGRRLVVFSGGETRGDVDSILEDIRGIRDGGANGSIIGRNTFQRPEAEAMAMLGKIIDLYLEA
jgi:class I fructose-bisphosphate aldolase